MKLPRATIGNGIGVGVVGVDGGNWSTPAYCGICVALHVYRYLPILTKATAVAAVTAMAVALAAAEAEVW